MTREEAITILVREIDEDPFWTTEYRLQIHEALGMGIEALEHECASSNVITWMHSPQSYKAESEG